MISTYTVNVKWSILELARVSSIQPLLGKGQRLRLVFNGPSTSAACVSFGSKPFIWKKILKYPLLNDLSCTNILLAWHDVQKMERNKKYMTEQALSGVESLQFLKKCGDPTLSAEASPCIIIPAEIVECF